MNRYTISGSEEFENKIDAILDVIVKRVLERIKPEYITALILGGGYGRGEGGVLKSGDIETLYNDLDLFVITPRLTRKIRSRVQETFHDLHKELSAEFGIDIDFSPPQPINVLPEAPFWMVWFDLKMGHKIIYGKENVLQYLPAWQESELPLMEALKLLLNRGVGLLLAEKEIQKPEPDSDFINRNIHKAIQAMGDAILIAEKKYSSSSIERISRLKNHKSKLSEYKPTPKSSSNWLLNEYQNSMNFKLYPEKRDLDTSIAAKWLFDVKIVFRMVYYQLWALYFEEAGCSWQGKDLSDYQKCLENCYGRSYPLHELLRNLVHNIRYDRFKMFSFDFYCRDLRYRLFNIFPYLLFGEEIKKDKLMLATGLSNLSGRDVTFERFISLWKQYN